MGCGTSLQLLSLRAPLTRAWALQALPLPQPPKSCLLRGRWGRLGSCGFFEFLSFYLLVQRQPRLYLQCRWSPMQSVCVCVCARARKRQTDKDLFPSVPSICLTLPLSNPQTIHTSPASGCAPGTYVPAAEHCPSHRACLFPFRSAPGSQTPCR